MSDIAGITHDQQLFLQLEVLADGIADQASPCREWFDSLGQEAVDGEQPRQKFGWHSP